jgi:hypothetical protein
MQYCPACHKPVFNPLVPHDLTTNIGLDAYCRCNTLTIRFEPTISSGTTMLPNGTGYGEIIAQSPYYGYARESTPGTPVQASDFSKWLGRSEPEECKAIREAREIIERELTP